MVVVKQIIACLIAACAFATAGCSTSTDPTTDTTTTAPTTPAIVENFSGTVPVLGSDVHNFTVVLTNDPITIDLTTAGPPATITEGFGIGSPVGGTCQLLSGGTATAAASATAQLSGSIPSGTYCFMVYDVGNQAAPITYTAVISHY